jgi:CubicO group peptidase (beta-lactamase class C family)
MAHKNELTCLKFSLLLCFLLFFQASFSQYDFKELDQKIIEKQKILGENVVAMVWKDTLVYKKEIGGFTSKTQAPIASCSKWLTAALVMTFVDEGKISLDDKVSKWLPIFAKYGKNYITIRHCLSHMTGIQSEPIRLLKLLERKRYKSLEEEVNDFAAKEIQANPGTEFRYSNIGLNIAGRVLEVITKKKFDQLMLMRIFRPLGMRNSTFTNFEAAVDPSGGAKSTANDYMNFLVMLLNNGMFNGQRILSEESIREMRQTQTKPELIKYAPKAAEGFNYALGAWVIEQDKSGNATALASPGLFGTWPMIDYCRGYAYIFFVKTLLGEERANAQMEIREVVNRIFPSKCK